VLLGSQHRAEKTLRGACVAWAAPQVRKHLDTLVQAPDKAGDLSRFGLGACAFLVECGSFRGKHLFNYIEKPLRDNAFLKVSPEPL
jgi:hypothetical protein